MSDLVKKVKIKKQDGTYTDYIPIGAEAKNVDVSDGESVEYKLNKKPYYYNNIIDMKADTKLKVGDMAITLGYYEVNDGGAGEYRIINGNHNDDAGSYHELDNHLFAELIVNNKVNVKQFGAKGNNQTNDYNMISNAISYILNNAKNVYQLYFPIGTYLISNTLNLGAGFNQISLIGETAKLCVLKMIDTVAEDTPMIKLVQGSGQVHCNEIKNLTLQGGNRKYIGILCQGGATNTIISLCNFQNFKKAIKLLNSGAEFTEFTKVRDCDFRGNICCVHMERTGTQNSFHGFSITGCTIGEYASGEHVIYIGRKCVWYNGQIDIVVWKSNTNSLIYSDYNSSDPAADRFLSIEGTIKIEGNKVFKIFEGGPVNRKYFIGRILSLGSGWTLGDVTLGNSWSSIASDASPAISPGTVHRRYANLMNGDKFYLWGSNSSGRGPCSPYMLVSGCIFGAHFEMVFSFTLIRFHPSNIAYKFLIDNWDIKNVFNQYGRPLPSLSINSSTGEITFNYTGNDADSYKLNMEAYFIPFSSDNSYEIYNADIYREA